MNNIKIYIARIFAITLIISVMSCESIMNVKPQDSVAADEFYKEQSEVFGAFIGLSGLFRDVAEQTLILSELKGDLMTPTHNAPMEFWEIYNYKADNNFSYTSSRRYYDLILNSNDFITRLTKFHTDTPTAITDDVYEGLISQAVNYKVWAYLTIGKFWGEVSIYSSVMDDIYDDALVKLRLEDLPNYLIDYLYGGENGVDAFNEFQWHWILDPTDSGDPDKNWNDISLDARVLLGELHLWNRDYQLALDNLIDYIADVKKYDGAESFSNIFRKHYIDVSKALVTVAPFSAAEGQENNLRKFFAPTTDAWYYFAPTDRSVELFASQEKNNFALGDDRGFAMSYAAEGGQRFILKYLLEDKSTDEDEMIKSESEIYIYRTSELSLMLAEAYCFLGRFEESFAFLEKGLNKYWATNAFVKPFNYLPEGFKDVKGVRARVDLLELDKDILFEGCPTQQDSIYALSDVISDEYALELAYEGKRWPALIRMASNLNDTEFLAKKISMKFGENASDYASYLKNRNNWFIKDNINENQ